MIDISVINGYQTQYTHKNNLFKFNNCILVGWGTDVEDLKNSKKTLQNY